MKNITSIKDLAGKAGANIIINSPETLTELFKVTGISESFLVRDYIGHKVANNVATALKGAFARKAEREVLQAIIDDEGSTDVQKKKATEELAKIKDLSDKQKKWVSLVEDGGVLNLGDFVKEPRLDPVVQIIREKWEASSKKVAFLAKYELDLSLESASAQEVELAYLARDKSSDSLL